MNRSKLAKRFRELKRGNKFTIKEMFPDKWKDAQKQCFSRDNHQCQFIKDDGKKCKNKKNLQMHHIIRKADNISGSFDVDNVITLCGYHHYCIKDKEFMYVQIFKKIIEENKNGK